MAGEGQDAARAHERIREVVDRSWTPRLVERLVAPDVSAEELTELQRTLEYLEDARAVDPLARILEDRSLPDAVREVAGSVLRGSGMLPAARVRAQWERGDALLKRHALRAMDRASADVIEPLARDPSHPLHREAIYAMEWGFEEPRFQALKVAALSHADPRVREAAADALAWDEPLCAEEPLHRAAGDPESAVAVAATSSLRYYLSQRTLVALAGRCARRGEPGETAEQSFADVRGSFLSRFLHADAKVRDALTAWMRPVWDLLAFDDDELHPPPESLTTPTSPKREAVAAAAFIERYGALDGPWASKRYGMALVDPSAFTPEERDELRTFLLEHPDPAIRGEAASFFAAWDDHRSLFRLASDPVFFVAKSATYWLGRTRPNPFVAQWARAHLDAPLAVSTHGYETLATWVAHAEPDQAIPLLARMVLEDERESLRCHAVHHLVRLRARDELGSLLPLLDEPPAVTWAVHVALLEACAELALALAPRRRERLRDVDHVDVQAALAPFEP